MVLATLLAIPLLLTVTTIATLQMLIRGGEGVNVTHLLACEMMHVQDHLSGFPGHDELHGM